MNTVFQYKFDDEKVLSAVEIDHVEDQLHNAINGKTHDYAKATAGTLNAVRTLRDIINTNGINAAFGEYERLKSIWNLIERVHYIAMGWDFPIIYPDLAEIWASAHDVSFVPKSSKFLPQRMGEFLKGRFNFISIPKFDQLYVYNVSTGLYEKNARDFIALHVRNVNENASTYEVNETTNYIKDLTVQDESTFDNVGDLINLKNGVYNLANHRLMPHDAKWHFRNKLPVKYDPMAYPFRFMSLLKYLTQDDPMKAIKILELFAWTLMKGYPVKKAVILYGEGDRGKSTLLNVLSAFLGEDVITHTPLQTLVEDRFSTAELWGKKANIAGEVGKGVLYDTDEFKRLTGDDRVEGAKKFTQEKIKFHNEAKLIFALNTLFASRDQTDAFYKRFELVELLINILEYPELPKGELKYWLTTDSELSGILNLVLDIFLPAMLDKRKFEGTEAVEAIRERYNLNANPVYAFVDEMFDSAPGNKIPSNEVFEAIREFCKIRGLEERSDNSVGRQLLRHPMGIGKARPMENGSFTNYYTNVAWVADKDERLSGFSKSKNETMIPFEEVLKSYIEKHNVHLDYQGYQGFLYLSAGEVSYSKGIQKTMIAMIPQKNNSLENQSNGTSEKPIIVSNEKIENPDKSPQLNITPIEQKLMDTVRKAKKRLSPKEIYDAWDTTYEPSMPPDLGKLFDMAVNLTMKTDLKMANQKFCFE